MPLRLFSCTILYSCLGHHDRVSEALVVKRSCEHPREVQLFCSSWSAFRLGHQKLLTSRVRGASRPDPSPLGRHVRAGSWGVLFVRVFRSFS